MDRIWSVLDLGCDDETRQAVSAKGIASLTSLYEIVKLAYITPNQPQHKVSSTV